MTQIIHRSFTAGEISPSVRSRADLVKYSSGLALCQNFIVRAQGGAYSRPGTLFVGEVGQSSRRARLIPFSFSTEQTYILVFENLTMRVIKDGGFVLDGAGPALFELATPYTEAQLSRLKFVQDADVMTITHPDHPPKDLSRTADDAWTLTNIDFTTPINPPVWATTVNATITGITQANPAVVTTSAAHGFSTNDLIEITGVAGMIQVNDRTFSIAVLTTTTFILIDEDSTSHTAYSSGGTATRDGLLEVGTGAGSFDKTYTYVLTAVNSAGEESIASTSKSITTKSLSTTAGIRLDWDAVDGASYYRIYKDPSDGTGIYGWIGDSENTTFDDFNTAPLTSDAPPDARDPFASTVVNITGITNANPAVVTSVGHGLETGYSVAIAGVTGMTEVNGNTYDITRLTDDTFSIGVDSTGYGTYSGPSGTATRTNNKPSVVGYYQQRRLFANTYNEPQLVECTQTAIYDSLRRSTPSRDDDSITFTIKGRQVNEIRHIVDVDALVLLTSGAEWKVTEGQDEVLTPSTFGARIQSYNGASWVEPAIIDDSIVYVQEKGSAIRDLRYQFADNKFSGGDISIFSRHLVEDYEIEEMSYSDEPFGILWMIRDDGTLLGVTYQKEHQVVGWHQHTTDGTFESVATIKEGDRDATYVVVKRTINGSTKRYVERFEPRTVTASEDVFCVDSGLRYNGSAATLISGLDHLEGKSVAVVADGNEVKGLTVASGQITLPRAASKVSVGLSYTPAMELLDIDTPGEQTLKGRETTVSRVILEVEKSRGGWVGPKDDLGATGTMYEIKPRFDSDAYDPIALKTFKQEVVIDPQWSLGGGIRIEQRAPLPLAVLSVIPEVDV